MRFMMVIGWVATLTAAAGCARSESPPIVDTARADTDRNAAGSGVPAGFIGRTDNSRMSLSGARYTASGDMWEVVTGPAHIVYRPQDIASGHYTASATIEQLEKPAHPEAFGIFIGGSDLEGPAQRYTYFLVRATGELAVKVRDGDSTRDVIKWTPARNVPKQDASGRASYALGAKVSADAIKFIVNGKEAASLSKVGLPADGVAGVRINHNLHLRISPVSIKRP
jgi:hypothetical protein